MTPCSSLSSVYLLVMGAAPKPICEQQKHLHVTGCCDLGTLRVKVEAEFSDMVLLRPWGSPLNVLVHPFSLLSECVQPSSGLFIGSYQTSLG